MKQLVKERYILRNKLPLFASMQRNKLHSNHFISLYQSLSTTQSTNYHQLKQHQYKQ